MAVEDRCGKETHDDEVQSVGEIGRHFPIVSRFHRNQNSGVQLTEPALQSSTGHSNDQIGLKSLIEELLMYQNQIHNSIAKSI